MRRTNNTIQEESDICTIVKRNFYVIRKAFSKVSVTKCDTYLSEFPQLRNHFERMEEETPLDIHEKRL